MTATTDLLYPGEAARILGVTEDTLERWADRGDIGRRYIDGQTRYEADTVRALLEAAPPGLAGVIALLEEAQEAARVQGEAGAWRKVRSLIYELRGE